MQPHQHRQILLEGRRREMPIDVAGALQEFLEAFAADDDFRDQTDGRPHRIAPAHPIPHGEAMIGGDAELIHGLPRWWTRRQSGLPAAFSPSAPTIHARAALAFVCVSWVMKVLEHTINQGLRRIDRAREILELRSIHIRHEVRRDIAAPLGAQRIAHQQRPQVRAADADVHDMLEFLARDPELLAAAHRADISSCSFSREALTSA